MRPLPTQFGLRRMLLLFVALGIAFSAFASWYWHSRTEKYRRSVVYPLGSKYVSSIGYANEQILFLRLNAIDPLEPRGPLDLPWCVPINMDMYSNDGWTGKCRAFTDADLEKVVKRHRRIRALDLRSSSVSDAGLRHLDALKQLQWLWLDRRHCSEKGLMYVRELSALRSLFVELDNDDPSLLLDLRNQLPGVFWRNVSSCVES